MPDDKWVDVVIVAPASADLLEVSDIEVAQGKNTTLALLLESADFLLLEGGDIILLEVNN